MKLFAFLSVFVFFGLVAAWSKEDYEIFGLQNDVATNEGANVTFYDLLEIRPNANLEQITKAYRKKSRIIHPDKVKRAFIANYAKDKSKAKSNQGVNVNQGPTKREIDAAVKNADARSARLNLVANVLRGPNRERYDHFLKNGFPLWKGTGYYYSRFRPGLGSVLMGLFLVFGGGGHYAGLILGWKRQRDFVDRYIRQARRAAWGDEMGVRGIPGIDSVTAAPPPSASESGDAGAVAVNRRQKRMMDKENKKDKKGGARVSARPSSGTSTPTEQVASTGERKRVVAENGKTLIVDSIGNVFLEEQNEAGERQEYLLDIDQIERPTIRQTLVCKLPIWCFNMTVGRVLGTGTTEEEVDSDESEEPVVEEAETTATSNSRSRKRNKRSQRS